MPWQLSCPGMYNIWQRLQNHNFEGSETKRPSILHYNGKTSLKWARDLGHLQCGISLTYLSGVWGSMGVYCVVWPWINRLILDLPSDGLVRQSQGSGLRIYSSRWARNAIITIIPIKDLDFIFHSFNFILVSFPFFIQSYVSCYFIYVHVIFCNLGPGVVVGGKGAGW